MDRPNEEIHEEGYQQNAEEVEVCHVNRLKDALYIIFRYLNYRDLWNAAAACRSWSDIAKHENSLRTGPYVDKTQYYFDGRFDFSSIRQSTIKPFLGLFFLQSAKEYLDCNVTDLCALLPRNCKTIILHAYNVKLNEILISNEHDMVFALLPQISNVQINMVVVEQNQLEGDTLVEYTQMIETVSRPNHESSTCIMLFCKKNLRSHIIGIEMAKVAYSKLCNSERISLCGGAISRNLMINNETGVHNSSCVALFITGSIRTWSIVFSGGEKEELTREKLQRFEEQVQLQKHSMGFVFYSNLLLMHHHRKEKVNMIFTIFKEIFPKVPLVGCCSSLEFGSYTDIKEGFNTDITTDLKANWKYNSSTTLMILTYG